MQCAHACFAPGTAAEDENVPFLILKYGVKLEEIQVYISEKYGTCFVTNPAELILHILKIFRRH